MVRKFTFDTVDLGSDPYSGLNEVLKVGISNAQQSLSLLLAMKGII